jgi:hypothetical protein
MHVGTDVNFDPVSSNLEMETASTIEMSESPAIIHNVKIQKTAI